MTIAIVAAILALATLILVAVIAFFLFSIALKAVAELDVHQLPRGQIIANETHLPPNCDEASDDRECKGFQVRVNADSTTVQQGEIIISTPSGQQQVYFTRIMH